MAAMGFVLAVILMTRILRSRFRLIASVSLLAVALLAGTILVRTLPEQKLARLTAPVEAMLSGQGPDQASMKRLVLYEAGIQLIKERPLLGYGGGAFMILGRDKSMAFDAQADTHSIYLDLYIESGLMGLLCFLFVYGSVIVALLRLPLPFTQRIVFASFPVAMLIVQAGGSSQLNRIFWVTLVIMFQFARLLGRPESNEPTPLVAAEAPSR
jgi:O-antigen ligase